MTFYNKRGWGKPSKNGRGAAGSGVADETAERENDSLLAASEWDDNGAAEEEGLAAGGLKSGKKKQRQEVKRTAKDEAMRYLEYRSHTASEVRSHLKKKEFPEDEIDECMEFLLDCHFIDDEEYCRRFIEYSMEKGRGPQRIRQELNQKGVSGELISIGMDELYDSETQRETALRQAEKALGAPGEEGFTEKELAKAARRLAGQGFSQSIVYDVLGRLRNRTE